ncbi:hypothetical protein Hanom_Chr17g01589951 [Helianthus anomalus]
MAEEFFNTFYNAFTSETSEQITVTPKSISKTITDNINHGNFYENHQRPPKLMNIFLMRSGKLVNKVTFLMPLPINWRLRLEIKAFCHLLLWSLGV